MEKQVKIKTVEKLDLRESEQLKIKADETLIS